MTSALVWLRRDLRLYDQAALHRALKQHPQVWVCFIFDTSILNPLLSKGQGFDRRVDFIWQTIQDLRVIVACGMAVAVGQCAGHWAGSLQQALDSAAFCLRRACACDWLF